MEMRNDNVEHPVARFPATPGTYLLQLFCPQPRTLAIGHLGELELVPGCYLYLGSAHGPGGLAARLSHRLHPVRRPHWHLDYLRQGAEIHQVWYSTDNHADECLWAAALARIRGCIPIFGFGASDCRCPSHLFRRTAPPTLSSFRRRLRQLCPEHGRIICKK
ncbi:hypothetical protein B5V00_11875 [Geothermobacter hydrogeniphilus]|uniref:Uri superfamily endonuclease n=2 Tax=Geothermobacter hydrogeniphilus TaxID=1969733 RepID=A0A1X0XZZ9_9BACT|nr:hypothetical protein B5V00_11875 [Geothermobacter hydrogeniphilus]